MQQALLREAHAAELAAALARMFDRWGSDPQKAWYLARAAVDLGSRGNELVLRAVRQHPTSPGISDLAVWAAEKVNPSDEFVQAVADQVLNRMGVGVYADLEPLLRSLVDGLNTNNYTARLELLCYKLRSVPEDDYGRRFFKSLRRGGSISDPPEPHRHDRFDALLHTLVESLRRAAGRVDLRDLLGAISLLPTDVADRVRAWLLGETLSVEPGYLISEVARAIASRRPTGDDLRLIDRAVAECDRGEYSTEWAEALGVPPSASALGSTLAARDVPGEWLRAFEWSGLLPPSVTAAWATAVALMSGVYGEPSRAVLEQPMDVEVGWVQSPLSESDLRAMTPDDAARWIASWRPDPSEWLVSALELGRTLEAVVRSDPTRWARSPLRTAGLLRHPTYISHYLQGFAAAALDKAPTDELVDLILFVRTHPWEAVPLGRDTSDFDRDWRGAEQAGIDLIKSLADSDIGFGERRDEVWLILQSEVERRDEPSGIVDGARDPLEAAINRPCTRALQAALSFMGYEFRTHGTVRPEALDLLSAILRLENRDGAEHRAILAPRIGFLRHIASDWVDEHHEDLFGTTAPADLGQLTVDLALKWGRPNSWLLEHFPDAVKNAVRRDVDNALAHYLTAMLWQLPRYSVEEVVDFLRSSNKLSAAGQALGRLLPFTRPEHARLAAQFWAHALHGGTTEALTGFGWLSGSSALDDDTWTDLTRRTLTATSGRIDWAHKVAERAAAQPPSTGALAILNQLVRGLADDWDRRSVTELAAQALDQARHLAHTPEYGRLRTALLERGMP